MTATMQATLTLDGATAQLPQPVSAGQALVLRATFTDGTPADPTIVLGSPEGATYIWSGADLTAVGGGIWTRAFTPATAGIYPAQALATAPSACVSADLVVTVVAVAGSDPTGGIPAASAAVAGLMAAADKAKLDGVAAGATRVTVPADIGAATAGALSAETTRAMAAEGTLTTNLAAETATRAAADAAILAELGVVAAQLKAGSIPSTTTISGSTITTSFTWLGSAASRTTTISGSTITEVWSAPWSRTVTTTISGSTISITIN